MKRTAQLLLLLACLGLSSACALPQGSFARPVKAPAGGTSLIGFGAAIPFAAVASATDFDDGASFGAVADGVAVVPAASYDYAVGERHTFGVEVSLLNSVTTSGGGGGTAFGIFVNPRWEMGVAENISIFVDLNAGYFTDGDNGVPFIGPRFGGRFYVPTGFGGLVISQALSTSLITWALPGSLAYDIPIPLGETTVLHIFPELRWDPTFVFLAINDEAVGGVISFFSAALTVMLEF